MKTTDSLWQQNEHSNSYKKTTTLSLIKPPIWAAAMTRPRSPQTTARNEAVKWQSSQSTSMRAIGKLKSGRIASKTTKILRLRRNRSTETRFQPKFHASRKSKRSMSFRGLRKTYGSRWGSLPKSLMRSLKASSENASGSVWHNSCQTPRAKT